MKYLWISQNFSIELIFSYLLLYWPEFSSTFLRIEGWALRYPLINLWKIYEETNLFWFKLWFLEVCEVIVQTKLNIIQFIQLNPHQMFLFHSKTAFFSHSMYYNLPPNHLDRLDTIRKRSVVNLFLSKFIGPFYDRVMTSYCHKVNILIEFIHL